MIKVGAKIAGKGDAGVDMGIEVYRKSCKTSKNNGFTLLEILLAIFILGIVMATILGTFTGIISSSRGAEKRADLHQTGRALMDLISTDIRCIFRQPVERKGSFFMGELESVEGASMSKMDFVTTNSLSIGLKRDPFLSEVGYRVKRDLKENTYTLWRRAQSPPEYPYNEGGREVPLCRIMGSFKLEFIYDSDIKGDSSDLIPKAVIIDFSLNQDGEKENFRTMVRPMITLGG